MCFVSPVQIVNEICELSLAPSKVSSACPVYAPIVAVMAVRPGCAYATGALLPVHTYPLACPDGVCFCFPSASEGRDTDALDGHVL
jgi:hypothetical protein